MYFIPLLLWRPSQPYNCSILELFQPMRLSPDSGLNFQGCISAPVPSVSVMLPPWHLKEIKTGWKGIYLKQLFQILHCVTSSCHGWQKCFPSKTVTSLHCKPKTWLLVVTSSDQDEALVAASFVHLGEAWSRWHRCVKWAASCRTHARWHHHWSLILCPSSASRWQGDSVVLYLSAAWLVSY